MENIQALENCELLIMTYDDLEKLYDQIPESNVLAREIAAGLLSGCRTTRFYCAADQGGEQVSPLLIHHQHLANRIPLKYIASYLGMTPGDVKPGPKEVLIQALTVISFHSDLCV